jgi:hypothetical protein
MIKMGIRETIAFFLVCVWWVIKDTVRGFKK